MRILALLLISALPAPAAAQQLGKVVGVHDGDTFTLRTTTDTLKVRLAGIDAPELGQPFGTRSKQALSAFTFGKMVVLDDAAKDKYGRTLGTIMVGGQSANLLLVAQGMAWHYKRYDKSPVMAETEEQARSNRLGLWVDPGPVPPWEWRLGKH